MVRRRKQGGAEDFMDVVAMLPWWGGVAVALGSYVAFHMLSIPPKVVALQPGQLGGFVIQGMIAGVASLFQWVVPVLALIAAMVSFAKRKKRVALVHEVAKATRADSLNGMTWREFELLVGESFRLQGYAVTDQGGATPDGGVDPLRC